MEAALQQFFGVLDSIMDRLDATDSKLEEISDRLNLRDKQDFRTPLYTKERIPPATEVFGTGTP
jgi:hypothetical protein